MPAMSRAAWLLASLLIAGCSEDPTSFSFSLHSTMFPGPFVVRGTIHFPADVEVRGAAALTLTNADTASPYTTLQYVDEAAIYELGTVSGSLDYGISALAAGNYLVGCIVNLDGDDQPSAGDLGGYYDGSAELPLQRASAARVIEIVDRSLDGVDFGVGAVTCLGRYGDPCTADTDCGGTLCSYPDTERVRGLHTGSCDTDSGVCIEAPGSCPLVDGQTGTKSESGCFGAGPE